MKECLLYMSLICCQPQNHLSALKVNNTWCYVVTLPVCDRQWPYAYSESRRGWEKERDGKKSAGSLVCIERRVRLRSLLFLSHTPPPLIFLEGIPPLLFDSSLSLWHHQSLASGRGGTGILKLAAWHLSFSPLPPTISLSLTQSPVRYL